MRLLNVDSLEFARFHDSEAPLYAIASHRWFHNEEASIQDLQNRSNTHSAGYRKVEAYARYVRENISPVKWLWIDTCCINQESTAELSEAINSMFDWYYNAKLCLVYLADVESAEDRRSFAKSEWHERGWCLQELVAPRTVVFLTKTWQVIGHKGGSTYSDDKNLLGPNLEDEIATITGISEQVLHDYQAGLGLSIDDKLEWMEGRTTTRPEDMSYALYGILGVTLGANYGEKFDGARQRLLIALRDRESAIGQHAVSFKSIVKWLSPPEPRRNHELARQLHEPNTGDWLLKSAQYQAWRSGAKKHLWVYGTAGCGKTVLCSTAVEDVRAYCKARVNTGHAFFYFSFSDSSKQTYISLVRSLVAQLGWKDRSLSMLRRAYKRTGNRRPTLSELQAILKTCIASYDEVYIHIDALDECAEEGGIQQSVFEHLQQLLQETQNVWMLATSRDIPGIRDCMENLGAEAVQMDVESVNADIRRHISTQLSRDSNLSQLDIKTKQSIEETLSKKANGIFQLACCQLQELKKVEAADAKAIEAAMVALPTTLDNAYEQILTGIGKDHIADVRMIFRWLVYAKFAASAEELAEACNIRLIDEPNAVDVVDDENQDIRSDTLEALTGLVAMEPPDELDWDDANLDSPSNGREEEPTLTSLKVEKDTMIQLAHFSVKEYLESPRILDSNAKHFFLDPPKEQRILSQSCLAYLMHYSRSAQKTSTNRDLETFVLLNYAAEYWEYHSRSQQPGSVKRELNLLASAESLHDWLRVWQPDRSWKAPFRGLDDVGSGLYYASHAGLETVVRELLNSGADVNEQGGEQGTPLQAASERGHEEVVRILLDAEANINTWVSGRDGNALTMAALHGHLAIVRILLHNGADFTADCESGEGFGRAQHAAALHGHDQVVQLLLDAGADINAQARPYGTALHAASAQGEEKVVRLLLDAGADVEIRATVVAEDSLVNALYYASASGYKTVVQMLLDAGADVSPWTKAPSIALMEALKENHEEVIQVLLEAGADRDTAASWYSDEIRKATERGQKAVVQMLLDARARRYSRNRHRRSLTPSSQRLQLLAPPPTTGR